MAYAINIRSDDASSFAVKALWREHELLEINPSMQALAYRPHITFAVYDTIATDQLQRTFEYAFEETKSITLRFEELQYFESPQGFVLWLKPVASSELSVLHEKIHSAIDPVLSREHYRPNSWVPHCSTATAIKADKKDQVLAVVKQGIQPFEVVFDVADYVSFVPVEILHEKWLAY